MAARKKESDSLWESISEKRKTEILKKFVLLYSEEFEETLSDFRAKRVLQLIIDELGPSIYNQAIEDASSFMTEKLEDLEAVFYKKEE